MYVNFYLYRVFIYSQSNIFSLALNVKASGREQDVHLMVHWVLQIKVLKFWASWQLALISIFQWDFLGRVVSILCQGRETKQNKQQELTSSCRHRWCCFQKIKVLIAIQSLALNRRYQRSDTGSKISCTSDQVTIVCISLCYWYCWPKYCKDVQSWRFLSSSVWKG